MHFQPIPIFRIFDETKAKAFYLDFLGMRLDWEHRFANRILFNEASASN